MLINNDLELWRVVLLDLDRLLVDLALRFDADLPEAHLGVLGELESAGQHSVVQFLRVPFSDDESVRVDDEEIGDARVRLQRRGEHHGADLDVLDRCNREKCEFELNLPIFSWHSSIMTHEAAQPGEFYGYCTF